MAAEDTGVELGAAYLAFQKKRYGAILHAIAAYNAGSATLRGNGDFVNQQYVDKWSKARKQYGVS